MTQEARITLAPDPSEHALDQFDRMMKAAEFYAKADILPAAFKAKPANILIAMELAHRVGQHWLSVAQALVIIDGRPSWYTSYLIALCNVGGVLDVPITWSSNGLKGDALAVTAKATLRGGHEVAVTIDLAEARRDGWTRNKKYETMPEQMLRWRTASRLVNLYAPEVKHGIRTVEELEDEPEVRELKVLDVAALEAKKPEPTLSGSLREVAVAGSMATPEAIAGTAKPKSLGRTPKPTLNPTDNMDRGIEKAFAGPAPDLETIGGGQIDPEPEKPKETAAELFQRLDDPRPTQNLPAGFPPGGLSGPGDKKPVTNGKIEPAKLDELLLKLKPVADLKGILPEQILSRLAAARCKCSVSEVAGENVAVLIGAVNKYLREVRERGGEE